MKPIARSFAKATLIYFLVMTIIAFTPLSFLPKFFSLALEDMHSFVLVLAIAGAPFGGFLFVLLFSGSGHRISDAASVAGFWIGTITGSWTGVKLLEVS